MLQRKIIFVGLHNKPGKMPLCSSTKSGKLIDRIIKEGGFTNVQKTNLFDVEYYPTDEKRQLKLSMEWLHRFWPDASDITVVLGAATQAAFPGCHGKTLKIAHPASKRSHADMNEYVTTTIEKIKSITSPTFKN